MDKVKEDITELRVKDAQLEGRIKQVEHWCRNNTQSLAGMENRIARVEGSQTWLLRIAVAVGTSITGTIYAIGKKMGIL